MRKLHLLFLLFIMSCATATRFDMSKPGFDFYNEQIENSIGKKIISKKPALLLNDSLITDGKSIKFILNRLPFDSISSLSIIMDDMGRELFNEEGKNGIIFIITTNFRKGIPQNPDTIPSKKAKLGDHPLFFLDNITIDQSFLQEVNENDLVSIELLNKEKCSIYFKDRCDDGIVFITTKKYAINRINARFSFLNKDYKLLNAGNVSEFEKLMFVCNDSLLNTHKGYIGEMYYDPDIKNLNVLTHSEAKERYNDFDINDKTVVEIIK